MLARSFLSADVLGISEIGRDALIKVLHMLERGEIEYADVDDAISADVDRMFWYSKACRVPTKFNMGWMFGESSCGTTACILGWAQHLSRGGSVFRYEEELTDGLRRLFAYQIPIPAKSGIWRASPAQAAAALSNYLTTGEPNWDLALASEAA